MPTGLLVCRICAHEFRGTWTRGMDEEFQECPACGHETCEPVAGLPDEEDADGTCPVLA